MMLQRCIWRRFAPAFSWIVLSALCLGLILHFAGSNFGIPGMARGTNQLDAGAMLSVLAVIQAVITFTTNASLDQACEFLQWKLSADGAGIDTLTFLSLSSTTNWWGLIRIVMFSKSKSLNRIWAASRLSLIMMIPLVSLLLFLDTNIVVDYRPAYKYPVTAGVGEFNGSMVAEYLQRLQNLVPSYQHTVLPYSVQAMASTLVANQMHSLSQSAVACSGSNCNSYFLTGGLLLTTPWPSSEDSSYSLVKMEKVIGRQIDFHVGLRSGDIIENKDCTMYSDNGTTSIAVRFCITESKVSTGSYVAGIFVCPQGNKGEHCKGSIVMPSLTTTFSLYNRKADIVVARSNFSIVSITNFQEPMKDKELDLVNFRHALDWLLDFDAAGIPAVASLPELFWSSQTQLSNEAWQPELYVAFQSILAFPIFWFNSNNNGNIHLTRSGLAQDLPKVHYTTAVLVNPYNKITLNTKLFVTFIVFESFVLALILCLLAWLCWHTKKFPKLSSYPLIDFALKAKHNLEIRKAEAYDKPSDDVFHAGDGAILKQLSTSGAVTSSVGLMFHNNGIGQHSSNSQISSRVAASASVARNTTTSSTTSPAASLLNVGAPRVSVDPQDSFVNLIGNHGTTPSENVIELHQLDPPAVP